MQSSFWQSLSRKKSISALQAEAAQEHGLKRALGATQLTALGIGAVIGAGIFVLTGTVAAQYAGPAIVISFALAALACGLAGLCYAEFASMIPLAGSAYTYAYATLGEFFAWFIGWDLVLEYALASATVAVGWSGYAVSFLRDLGLPLPPEIMAAPGTQLVNLTPQHIERMGIHLAPGWHILGTIEDALKHAAIPVTQLTHTTALFNFPAILIVGLCTTLIVIGIRESANFNSAIVALKLAVILVVIAVGVFYVDPDNWVPFIPPNTGKYGEYGWSGIARGAGVIFFAYIGFDAVSTAAQESKRPQRDLPIGILASLAICTVLYIVVSLILTGIVSYRRLAVPDPIAVAIDAIGIRWLALVVKIGAIAGISSVVLVLLFGQSRVFYSMAKDGLLPNIFAELHPRFKTPAKTAIATGFFVALVAALLPIGVIGELVSIGTLAAFAIVSAAVLILRRRQPDLPRAFRTPFVPWVPLLGIGFCLYAMLGLPLETWIRLAIWLALGQVIYFAYGRQRSHLRNAVIAENSPVDTDLS